MVADVLFEFFHFGESALLFSVPDGGLVDGDCVGAAGVR